MLCRDIDFLKMSDLLSVLEIFCPYLPILPLYKCSIQKWSWNLSNRSLFVFLAFLVSNYVVALMNRWTHIKTNQLFVCRNSTDYIFPVVFSHFAGQRLYLWYAEQLGAGCYQVAYFLFCPSD